MYAPAVFDLHCDTLTAFRDAPSPSGARDTLDRPGCHFALSKLPAGTRWCQCCAIFLPDRLRGTEAVAYYERHRDSFYRQMAQFSDRVLPCRTAADIEGAWAAGKAAAVLTVENGSALAGRLERVEQLARDGVRMMTLTWNGANELGSGNDTGQGLTPFGREAVREMEAQGILVDVSHLNDRGFDDLLSAARRPFVASHSNARWVCGHRRNLTDDQIRELVRRRCLIGLNYYCAFLRDDGQVPTLDDLYRHAERFLALGAEDCLALGSDFDGADLPPCLDGPEKIAGLYCYFLKRGLSPALAEKIMWRNALTFFRTHLSGPAGRPDAEAPA